MKNEVFILMLIILTSCFSNKEGSSNIVKNADTVRNIINTESNFDNASFKKALFKIRFNNAIDTIESDSMVSLEWIQDNFLYIRDFRYPKFKSLRKDAHTLLLTDKKLQFEITSSKFDAANMKVTYSKDRTYIEKINGKDVWGSDGNIPKTKLSKILLRIDNKSIVIPSKYYDDLFEPNLNYEDETGKYHYINAYLINKETIMLYMLNGDAAGGYGIIFC